MMTTWGKSTRRHAIQESVKAMNSHSAAPLCVGLCVCVFVHVRVRACVRRKVGGRDEGAV